MQYLFNKYIENRCSPEEVKLLLKKFELAGNEELLRKLIRQQLESEPDKSDVYQPLINESFQKLSQEIKKQEVNDYNKIRSFYRNIWWKVAAAAVVFIILGTASFYLFLNKGSKEISTTTNNFNPANDIPPGGNKAILTLGNGNQIILDTASTGMISRQSGAQIVKSGDGQVEYQSDNSIAEKIDYNTISTPQGGQYQLTLSDGSKVWLNAASSIRFPAVFKGKERKVFITGEAYFEVNPQSISNPAKKGKQKNIPFIVDLAGKGTVEVLGTHFNINAYADEEAIKTTLLEGSVKFTPYSGQGLTPFLITPGQQAVMAPDGQIVVNDNVDLEKVVAWKNGYFIFSSSSVQEVMNQIARWYDIEVVIGKTIGDRKFGGKIQRDLILSDALEILETNNIHFKMEGKRLYVNP